MGGNHTNQTQEEEEEEAARDFLLLGIYFDTAVVTNDEKQLLKLSEHSVTQHVLCASV